MVNGYSAKVGRFHFVLVCMKVLILKKLLLIKMLHTGVLELLMNEQTLLLKGAAISQHQ